jgi:hypothetical protein
VRNSTTIVMPLYGHTDFADLAVRSMVRHSVSKPSLLLVVEPVNTEADEEWLRNVATVWPWGIKIIRNQQRRGYYGSVNVGIRACHTDHAIIFTSDQVASPNWDYELLRYVVPRRFVTGRLIESGANLIADGNIWKRFGFTPEGFDETAFLRYCAKYPVRQVLDVPRHYIPMAFRVEDFVQAGMFVEGRDSDRVSTYREDFYFFLRCFDSGHELVEVQKPLTYHFQSGSRPNRFRFGVLNLVYPFGLKHIHRWLTGYVSLYDALVKRGAKNRLRQILGAE